MKFRLVSTVAVAAGIALGATGCGLIAPQSTLQAYAPSDGIDVSVSDVDVRDLLLVADTSGENFNVVFTAVNDSDEEQNLTIEVNNGGQTASANFKVPAGTTQFGHPEGKVEPQLLPLQGVQVGSTVEGYISVGSSEEVKRAIPVLDGTLKEYSSYVVDPGLAKTKKAVEQAQKDAKAATEGEGAEGESTEAAE